jgi:hypothetical protein
VAAEGGPAIPLRDSEQAVLRCAPYRASLHADPVGTAGCYDGFLCLEIPLPWPRDISMAEPFRSLLPVGADSAASLDGADGRTWRPMGLVPASTVGAAVTVLAFDRPAGMVCPYRRREWRVPAASVPALCHDLLAAADPTATDPGPDGHAAHRVDTPDGLVELLVCTHGRRDVCCGGLGTTLHGELADVLADRADVRLWRCSHTGGHRFAPTALTLPDGYGWAFLDVAAAMQVVDRDRRIPGGASTVVSRCRGNSLVAGGPAQAADRAALDLVGWDWAESVRTVEVGDGSTPVRVRADVDGRRVDLAVTVALARHVPNPACGTEDGPGDATDPVWEVRSVVAVGPDGTWAGPDADQ